MIICTDLHLKEESEDIVLGEIMPGILNAALASKETEVACLGDVWSVRYRALIRLMVRMKDELARHKAHGVNWTFIPGNHDMFDVNGRNILECFDSVATIYTKPTSDARGIWIPYHHDQKAFAETFSSLARSHKGPKVAFIHADVRGGYMNSTIVNDTGLDPSSFDGWRVFSGHYHKRHVVTGKVEFIGTAWETRSDEAGQPKGYAHWDGKSIRYVDTAWGPRHYKIYANANNVALPAMRPGDVVHVTTAPGVNPEVIGKQLASMGLSNHTVTPMVEQNEARLHVGPGATLDEYAIAYVNAVSPPDLNRDRLLSIFKGFAA
jgi:hypothetical protein